jgi:hypothetical protein
MNDATDASPRTHARFVVSLDFLIIEPPQIPWGRSDGRRTHPTETNRGREKIRSKVFLPSESFRRSQTSRKRGWSIRESKDELMKRTVVRYKAKPEKVEENQRLIEKVFQELHAKSPQGVRYLALKLGDGTFVHFAAVETESASISGLEAFRSFRCGINERCAEPPQAGDATIIGNYRMLGETENIG